MWSPSSAAVKTARSRARTVRKRGRSASVTLRAIWVAGPKRSRSTSTEVRVSLLRSGSSVLTRRTAKSE
ncbi:hypothetical protein STANM309S_02396 [Streptomyces tanashiensis]